MYASVDSIIDGSGNGLEDKFTTVQQLPVHFVSLFPVPSGFICVYSQFWPGSYSNV